MTFKKIKNSASKVKSDICVCTGSVKNERDNNGFKYCLPISGGGVELERKGDRPQSLGGGWRKVKLGGMGKQHLIREKSARCSKLGIEQKMGDRLWGLQGDRERQRGEKEKLNPVKEELIGKRSGTGLGSGEEQSGN